ncbi:iron ABC transporter permease [Leucobacter sp. Psy1]|uniref:ABC transporter permease n=1 Tax=Leucobacter sp. Psy1 TaxID=2875729 RepID=UPI001CD3DC4D|nr:iron ABC transporter permease [Leucobacter sp. Psy1]UBH06309.1 iron ABC transporter permease [Leucobacter sp. Psy1]
MSVQTAPITQAYSITREKRRRQFSPWLLLTVIAVILALVFVAWPIVNVLLSSFTASEGGPLDGWKEFFADPAYLTAVGNTLLLAAIVTVLATTYGVFLAYFTSRFRFWAKAVIAVLPVTAILVPEVIVTQAWLMFLGNNGFLTRLLRDTAGIEMPTLYGWRGLILILPLLYYTYVYLGTLAALKGFDSQLEEAAMSLGSSPLQARFKVMIPAIFPAVASTSIVVFTLTLGNFATSTIIGGDVDLLAPLTYRVFLAETGGDPMMQSTLATTAIAIVALVLFLQRLTVGRKKYEMVQGRAWVPIRVRGASGVFLSIITAILLIASTLPLVMVIVIAFTASSGPVLRWGEFSLDNLTTVLSREPQPILNTLTYGGLACLIGILVSIVVSVVIVKKKNFLTPALDYLVMLPMALSGTVLGIGMMSAFGAGPIGLGGTGAIIVLVFVIRRLVHGVRNSSATLHAIPDSLEDASVSLGVPPFKSFLKVVLPLMVPGIAAATVLTWTTIIAELSASLVVYSAGRETITIKVFQLMGTGLNGQAAAYGLILVVLAIVPIVIATRVFKIRLFT